MRKQSYTSLAEYLKRTGTTQAALAARLGCSQSRVSKWVNGFRLPRPAMALRLSKVTGVSLEALTRARSEAA